MVSKNIVAATVVAAAGANAQMVDGIISSLAAQISNGLVAGRKSDVPESQVASEVGEIMAIVHTNSELQNVFTEAAGMVLGGINSDGVISFISLAEASIAAFQQGEDGKSFDSLVSKHITDLDAPKALDNVQNNLAPVLNLVVPQVSSLSAGDENVASAVNGFLSTGAAIIKKYTDVTAGPASTDSPASSDASSLASDASSLASEASSAASAASSAATSAATSAASSDDAAVSTTVTRVSSSATVTATATSTAAQVTGAADQNKVQAAMVAGVAAAGLLFL